MNDKQIEEKLTLLDDLQSACTGCGLCLEACATYQSSGWEHESPRGRIHLAAQFLHGRILPQSPALSTFDRCLGCQACELLCPQNVPYRQVRQLVQELRGLVLNESSPSSMEKSQYKRWITLAYRIGHQLWRRYLGKSLKIPSIDIESQGSFTHKSKRPIIGQPVLAVCCMQDLFQHEMLDQTLVFMQRLGCSLAVDKKQPCCGAIFERLIHGGEETVRYSQEQQKAVTMQHKTLNSFLKWLPSQVFFLAKGCQCFVSKHTSRALDLYAWIETLLNQQKLTLYFPECREVYYQPYCSSQERWGDPIWRLLHQMEGLIVRDVPNPMACCGGYCGEILLHPQHAQILSENKIAALPEGSTIIVASPDCWGLFKRYQGNKNLTILYPIQLIAKGLIKNKIKN
jgi:glycolate oxidase iron-sulfur subunit